MLFFFGGGGGWGRVNVVAWITATTQYNIHMYEECKDAPTYLGAAERDAVEPLEGRHVRQGRGVGAVFGVVVVVVVGCGGWFVVWGVGMCASPILLKGLVRGRPGLKRP